MHVSTCKLEAKWLSVSRASDVATPVSTWVNLIIIHLPPVAFTITRTLHFLSPISFPSHCVSAGSKGPVLGREEQVDEVDSEPSTRSTKRTV